MEITKKEKDERNGRKEEERRVSF
jgi:hypothetical protein